MNVHFDDDAADRILSGSARPGDEAELASLLSAVVAQAESTVPVASSALARAFATGSVGIEDHDNVVPITAATGASRPGRRRALAVRTAVVVGVVSVAFGGVAAAGGLPDPLQAAAANAARVIGVSIPDPRRPETDPDPSRLEAPTSSVPVPETPADSIVDDDPVVEVDEPGVDDDPVVEVDEPEVEDDPVVEVDEPEVDDDPVVEVDEPEVEDDPVVEVDEPEVDDDPVVEVDEPEVDDDPVVDTDDDAASDDS
jgi:hypothetical protein